MLSIRELLIGRSARAGGGLVDGALLELLEDFLAVEQSGGLLQRASLGLNSELPHEGELEAEPCDVDDVVLPLEGTLGDRVHVPVETVRKDSAWVERKNLLVEHERAGDSDVHDREHLGTKGVWGNLDSV